MPGPRKSRRILTNARLDNIVRSRNFEIASAPNPEDVMKTAWIAASLLAMGATAQAQEGSAGARISVELNSVTQMEAGCQLTFVTETSAPNGVEQVVFETVLFDTNGGVRLLTLFDFGSIPATAPRVRQFVIPQTSCSALGRILINGVATCTAPGLPQTACASGLSVTSRVELEFLG